MNKITLIIGILFLFSFASVFAITVKLSSPLNLTIVDSNFTFNKLRLNKTFAINTEIENEGMQYLENFESLLYNAQDVDISDASANWYDSVTNISFLIKKPDAETTYGFPLSSSVGFYNDSLVGESNFISRQTYSAPGLKRGRASAKDWMQFEINFNFTTTATYGCIFEMAGVTGNEISLFLTAGDHFIVLDNLAQIDLGAIDYGHWYTIRFTAEGIDEWFLTIDGTKYGAYKLYNGYTWVDDVISSFSMGTLIAGDNCAFYIDNWTDSFEQSNPFTITPKQSYMTDAVYTEIDSGGAMFSIPNIYHYLTDMAANLYIDEEGKILRAGSSEDIKYNISNLTTTQSSKLYNIQPIQYTGNFTGNLRYGFSAEQTSKVCPMCVDYDSGHKPANINLPVIVAMQSQEIIKLNNKINSLETRISALEKLLGVIPKP